MYHIEGQKLSAFNVGFYYGTLTVGNDMSEEILIEIIHYDNNMKMRYHLGELTLLGRSQKTITNVNVNDGDVIVLQRVHKIAPDKTREKNMLKLYFKR